MNQATELHHPAESKSHIHERLLTLQNVEAMTGFKSSFIYAEVKKGNFPKPIKIYTASRWPESEVQNWINQQIEKAQHGQ